MIFKKLFQILITTPRWQLWLLTLLLLCALPTLWYRAWYAPRKAACDERERLIQALSELTNAEEVDAQGQPHSIDYFRRAIIQAAAESGVGLEKIGSTQSQNDAVSFCVAFSGSYENLADVLVKIEEMPLLWLSFVMSETSLIGTLTPRA